MKTQHQQFFQRTSVLDGGVDYLEDKEGDVSQVKGTKEVIVPEVDSNARNSRESMFSVKVRNNIDKWKRLDNRFVESIITDGLKKSFS